MNPVERDIRGYFGIAPEDSILEHYGTKRHSGRYPWGSGENPYQRSGDFLSRVEELKKSGMKEKDILQTINDSLPEEYKMGATEFRMAQRRAIHERQQLKYDRARALSQDGLGPTEIGREMGLSESTVRSMLKNDKPDKYTRTKEIAETLRKEVDKKGMIDVSEGTNLVLGVSEGDLDDAIFVLEAEHGYQRYGVGMTLKASSFPGQATKVILPLSKIGERECYCPTYPDGTQLALVRFPHAGTFEIPIVTVNNKNLSGRRNLGNVQDAIGINAKVAERLNQRLSITRRLIHCGGATSKRSMTVSWQWSVIRFSMMSLS